MGSVSLSCLNFLDKRLIKIQTIIRSPDRLNLKINSLFETFIFLIIPSIHFYISFPKMTVKYVDSAFWSIKMARENLLSYKSSLRPIS